MKHATRPIPRDTGFDATLAWLRDPFGFISERCGRHGTDLFQTRLLLRPAICITGPEAAALFYDESKFVRRRAMPIRFQQVIFGRGGVQGLDGDAHRHRKQMFMSLMTSERVAELGRLSHDGWRGRARSWARMDRVVLYDEARELLTRAVCAWSGVPLAESDVARRTRQLTALFEGSDEFGPRYWRALWIRRSAERWLARLVCDVRTGRIGVPEQSAVAVIASFRAVNGELLPPRVAAVELLSVLRPTVAVAVFIVFAAHALDQHAEWRARLAAGDERDAKLFVQEVRRCYPFFPAVFARVRQDFEWKGYRFARGTRTLLDLWGTCHDPRAWDAPDEFRPERFERWDGNPFTFVPQGGGSHDRHHRCAGEWITVELMTVALRFLVAGIRYEVPAQDLRIDRSQLPPLPRSGFILRGVEPIDGNGSDA